MRRKQKKDLGKILRALRFEAGGDAAVVQYRSPFKVLISTVLSARTRDENTAKAGKRLFAKFRTPKAIANAGTAELQRLIKPCGFYRVKAKVIRELSRQLLLHFGGKVPQSIEELVTLSGVGRKTANCVLVYAFGKPAIPVDVHVHRVSNRIGIVKTRKPEETERALENAVPGKYWIEINNLMVKFGRKRCMPVKPKCEGCKIAGMCDYYKSAKT